MNEKRNPLIYRLLYFAIYAGDALFTPFYSLFFISVGLSSLEQSILLALIPFTLFIGNYLFSFFATSYKRNVNLMRWMALAQGVGIVLFGFMQSFASLCVLTIFICLFNSSYFQIEDAASAVSMKKLGVSYSSIRIFGSIAYAAALLAGYFLVGNLPYKYLFVIAGCLMFIGFALTFLIAKPSQEDIHRDAETKEEKADPYRSFFKNKSFVLFLVFYAVFFGCSNTAGYIIPVYLNQLGLLDNEYSLWSGVRVLAEILSFIVFPFLFKIIKKHKTSLIVGSSFFLLSALLFSVVTDRYWLVSSSFLARGFANGFIIISSVSYLQNLVGDKNVARALTLEAGLSYMVTGIGNLVASYIYTALSFQAFFLILFVIQALAFVLLFFVKVTTPPTNKLSLAQK
ncbi:MAG: MFS transporter [Bacilli bacterium]|jgi:PPP family 3-phenylpropionic acid transporter|nr:MFS transporter [Bacilli bacterium]MCH4277949.1 MFS transporter [Bacilli bacterium]